MAKIPEALLVDHLDRLRHGPISQKTRERLAQALLDWYTAGWAAIGTPAADNLRMLAQRCHGETGPAPVFGGCSLPSAGAAFANAGIAHLREIDDAHRSAMLHPGIIAISPVMALAADIPLTQRQVADAIIAGYEVSLRVGEALGTEHAANFHATATAGALGAAAASAVALGLHGDSLHHTLGIAATQAAGLWQLVDDNAHESKSLHPAMAVRNGLLAAYAAQAGFPGAQAFVTGRRGLYRLLHGDGPLARLTDGFEAEERINSATIKAWPCCAQLFTPLDAIQTLMQAHGIHHSDIESVNIEIFPHALKIAGVVWPTKPAETCFCLPYVAAMLLKNGQLRIHDMDSPQLEDATLLGLVRRISVTPNDAFQQHFPEKRPARVTVTLRDGRQFAEMRELRRGDPEQPYTFEALEQRMRAFAPAMSDASATRITAWCKQYADPQADRQICSPAPDLYMA